MFATSLDMLHMSLAIGFIILVIFLSIALLYLIFILRDTSKMTQDAREVTDKVNQIVVSPLKMIGYFMDQAKPIVDSVKRKVAEKQRKRRKDED